MSSRNSSPITISEMKEIYDTMSKERLVEIVIKKTLEIRKLNSEISGYQKGQR